MAGTSEYPDGLEPRSSHPDIHTLIPTPTHVHTHPLMVVDLEAAGDFMRHQEAVRCTCDVAPEPALLGLWRGVV